MEQRYSLLRSANVRNISEYNRCAKEKLPYVVAVIDEYGDLVMTAGKQVEKSICRIAQKARAVGIHMIISTQRPSVTIVTGNIKANFPTRIAFRTTTGTDSRVIIDRIGAEKLTGRGDMLFCMGADITRVQCAYVDANYILDFRDFLSEKYEDYNNTILIEQKNEETSKRIFLFHPLYPEIEELAHKVADTQGMITPETIRILLGGSFYTPYDQMHTQLAQLGIIDNGNDWYSNCHVVIRDHEQISDIIRRAREFEPDK